VTRDDNNDDDNNNNIPGSYGGKYEDDSLLEYCAVKCS
jgi:hypothetical protein